MRDVGWAAAGRVGLVAGGQGGRHGGRWWWWCGRCWQDEEVGGVTVSDADRAKEMEMGGAARLPLTDELD